MTILLVDDQKAVIDGLLVGVDFASLGFETVRVAYGADQALEILSREPVDVLITDIEMPGKNGLELNSIVREQYPETLRILLTSHAVFSYAQEGIRLGCFDYLVQPVPYSTIMESLKKAALQIENNRRVEELGGYGELFKLHRSDFLNTVTYRLYSRDHRELIDAISLLRQAGYELDLNTECQLIVLDVFDFSAYAPRCAKPSQPAYGRCGFSQPVCHPADPELSDHPDPAGGPDPALFTGQRRASLPGHGSEYLLQRAG